MIKIDLKKSELTVEDEKGVTIYPLASQEAFSHISKAWLRCGWDNKYVYSFTWFGRPIIQLPEDLIRIQEIIFSTKPDVIIETGIAHGGSLIFYASLCKAMDKGRVIGVDIEIRPHNRKAIESHPLFPFITLIEGDSVDTAVVNEIKGQIKPGEKVLVLLDSRHDKEHVLAELDSYASLVTVGSYIVVMDGIMEQLTGAPRTQPDWLRNNPKRAAIEFIEKNPCFTMEEPQFLFNEGSITERITYWPGGFIRRIG
ncbi:MAG: CmcI family methyltransferase [bacterium]